MISLEKIFIFLSFLTLFISGVSRDSQVISIVSSIPTICVGLILIIKEKKRLETPKNFIWMFVFIAILYIYTFFVKDKTNPFSYAAIFTIGSIFWIIFYNLKRGNEILYGLVLKLALAYSFLYLITKIFNLDSVPLSKLYFTEGLASRHYHIGDLWAFTLLLILGKSWGKFDLKTWLLLDLGFLFLVLSNARSAYLSLGLGFIYIVNRKIRQGSYKKFIPLAFGCLIILLFVFSSISKTTLFSRPYFTQSVEAFSRHPLGVGMGNFKQIGLEYYAKTEDASKFSLYTHNIFLEALSGVGIFSLLFLKFIYSTALDILREKGKNLEWGALVIAIIANFMFDTTYTIPGLIWIMFVALGVFQSKNLNSNSS